MFNVEIFWNFDAGIQKNIFCFLSNFTMKLTVALVYLLYKSSCFRYDWSGNCLHPSIPYVFFLLAWYYDDKKHFCSFLTDLTTFHTVIIFVSPKVPSAMIWKQSEWDVKRIHRKDLNWLHFCDEPRAQERH